MQEIRITGECPGCGQAIRLTAKGEPKELAPDLRSELTPVEAVLVYRVTSDDIKKFIVRKVHNFVPDAKLEIVPIYCEKKKRKDTEVHHSYASIKIAFSDDVIEDDGDYGWFGKIGEANGNTKIKQSMFGAIIKRYQYDRKEIDKWLKNYKTLEELEEGLGMTEAFINEMKEYTIPKRVPTGNGEDWIFFSADPIKILRDMFVDANTGKSAGRIHIQDVYPVTKDTVEFIIYLHPEERRMEDNPHVRQILQGDVKIKK